MSEKHLNALLKIQTTSLSKVSRMKFRNFLFKFIEHVEQHREEWGRGFWQHIGENHLAIEHEKIYLNGALSSQVKKSFDELFSEGELEEIFKLLEYSYFFYEKNIEKNLTAGMESFFNVVFTDPNKAIEDGIKDFFHNVAKPAFYQKINKSPFEKIINDTLLEEKISYSFRCGKFIPHYSKEARGSIDKAIKLEYENPATHIEKAAIFLENHQNPDYANSIKESISAVESLAKEITGENNFDKAINKLKENGVKLHPQFEMAIKNMYQFTSDTSRHGHSTEKNLQRPEQNDQATARYMLIVCSAIVNFITDKAADKKP